MGRAESIMSNVHECYICHRSGDLHLHHIYYASNRKHSDEEGCWCWLCPEHHNMSRNGVHFNQELNLKLKRECQERWEKKNGSREKFREIFGKSYL